MSGTHARLSASSAHRWLHCAGSVNASAGKDSTSIHAATGTFAHDIAARCLADDTISPSDFLLKEAIVDGHPVKCDMEMVDAVRLYVDEINGDHQEGDEGWIEMSLAAALKRIDPDFGGTADYVRYRASTRALRVVDFKYGSGVFVESDDNPQLKTYALGAMLEVGKPVDEVEVQIIQPRFEGAQPVRTWKFKAVEILDFVADLKEAAEKTRLPNPPFVADEESQGWCKFCPAARTCPELERRQHALIRAEFGPATVYDLEALEAALVDVPLVKERIKALEEFAYAEATRGVAFKRFKLVEKRPVRKWKSEGEVVMWAQANAIDPYAPRELLSPAQIEKKLAETAPRGKKKEAGRVLDPFVEKVSSGTALVPVSDERAPAKLVSASDFEVLPSPK